MIYFKITDTKSEAFARHLKYQALRTAAFQRADDLRRELGVESEHAEIHGGQITSFAYQDGQHRPTGLVRKGKRLVPNTKSDWGRKVKARMEEIRIPTAYEYMERIFGAGGEMLKGTDYFSGCGLITGDEMALISVKMPVWENAQEKDGFEVPEGVVEITASEYKRLRDELLDKGKAQRAKRGAKQQSKKED